MNGDNFKPVSADTSAWVLQQFRDLQDLPLPEHSGKAVRWPLNDVKPFPMRRLPSKMGAILAEVARDHDVLESVILSHSQYPRAVAARYDLWARCRDQIRINGKSASYAWIGAQGGFDSSSVIRGAAIHRGARRAGR